MLAFEDLIPERDRTFQAGGRRGEFQAAYGRTIANLSQALKKLEVTFYSTAACLVRLSEPEYGSLDAKKLAAVRELLVDLVSLRPVSSLILDVSSVQFFGAGFAGVLVDVWNRLQQRSRRLAVCGLTPYCARVVRTLRLHQLFDIYPTEIAALAALDGQSHGRLKKLSCHGARVYIRGVDWDPNMVRVSYIGEDDVPVWSEVHPREASATKCFQSALGKFWLSFSKRTMTKPSGTRGA